MKKCPRTSFEFTHQTRDITPLLSYLSFFDNILLNITRFNKLFHNIYAIFYIQTQVYTSYLIAIANDVNACIKIKTLYLQHALKSRDLPHSRRITFRSPTAFALPTSDGFIHSRYFLFRNSATASSSSNEPLSENRFRHASTAASSNKRLFPSSINRRAASIPNVGR